MSLLVNQDVPCTFCQFPNEAEVWSIINVKSDPELKDILVGGEINMIECRSCREFFYAEHLMIYHDPDQEIMAFVFPEKYGDEKERWIKKMNEDFTLSQSEADAETKISYKPQAFFGIKELMALIERDNESQLQSDILAELAKGEDLGLLWVNPALARNLKIPTLLPIFPSTSLNREGLVAGLEKLMKINPHLFVFRDTLAKIQSEPSLINEIDFSRPRKP